VCVPERPSNLPIPYLCLDPALAETLCLPVVKQLHDLTVLGGLVHMPVDPLVARNREEIG